MILREEDSTTRKDIDDAVQGAEGPAARAGVGQGSRGAPLTSNTASPAMAAYLR